MPVCEAAGAGLRAREAELSTAADFLFAIWPDWWRRRRWPWRSNEAKVGGGLHNTRLAIVPTRFLKGRRRQQPATKL